MYSRGKLAKNDIQRTKEEKRKAQGSKIGFLRKKNEKDLPEMGTAHYR